MNTPNKRASAIGIGLAIRLVLPISDGTIDQSDRQQTAYSYAGITAASPVPIPNLTYARGVLVSSPSFARGVRVQTAAGAINVRVR